MTGSLIGIVSLLLFSAVFVIIAMEEKFGINKSKPALFLGTFLYLLLGVYHLADIGSVPEALRESAHAVIFEIAEIFFFLFVAMTYIEALNERGVFEALKNKVVSSGMRYKKLLWVSGLMTFFISAVADNLTTALIFATVIMTVEKKEKKFLVPAAVNIVVASNAGGAWSPFGDITTLMIWNAGKAPFADFFYLFPASFAGWALTCFLLSLFVEDKAPTVGDEEEVLANAKEGAGIVVFLGIFTIACAVLSHQLLHLPAIIGMMFGLSLLMLYGFSLKRKKSEDIAIFKSISKIENDTLLFFFGLMASVGALGYIGYLSAAAKVYEFLPPFWVNVSAGLLSAVIDNVPLTYAILKASPAMEVREWLFLALTVGTGGSLIAFGSAAGVAVMGKMRGVYTFSSHMRYFFAVFAGYVLSVGVWYVQALVFGIY